MASVLDSAVEVYRNVVDRSGWGEGPWDAEDIDKMVWVDSDTDLDCMIVRNRMGAWCGYVGVGPRHPLHGVGYGLCTLGDACDSEEYEIWCEHRPDSILQPHGGVTFSDFCVEDGDPAGSICHIAQEGRPSKVWWFGFDCGHAFDVIPYMVRDRELGFALRRDEATYKTMEYAISEVRELARQLAEVR